MIDKKNKKDLLKKNKDDLIDKKSIEDDLVFEENECEEGFIGSENLKKKYIELKQKHRECQKEKKSNLINYQKTHSEMISLRKRYEQQVKTSKVLAEKNFSKKLLPVLDSFSLAFSNKKDWEDLPESWRKGMENVYNQLFNTLRQYGVNSFSPTGEQFNPELHEAVAVVEVKDKNQDNVIVDVIQEGYIFDDSLLRTAKVKVGQCLQEENEDSS